MIQEFCCHFLTLLHDFLIPDESLQEFTTTTNTFKALQYELTDTQLKNVDNYVKNLNVLRKASDIVYPYSNSKIYIASQGVLGFYYWKANRYNGVESLGFSYTAMKDHGATAKSIFDKMKISESAWLDSVSEYL